VTLILDAGPMVALADRDDPLAPQFLEILTAEPGPLILPAPTTAEVDYMLGRRFGGRARRAFLADLAAGRYEVAALAAEEYSEVASLDARYADLELGLADCATVVLARRFRTRRLLTLDERHFRAVAPLQGGSFELLPADAG
jgi:predicted nucleic acid-binding protein